ncbi:helix-turn-helix domain-containing protein [Levilactobacillus brevis]|uniref:helix-turn-helix domain-containing protein n=1 Tax=Levilactobacillus brevis TaxID=1580 RepID=UPI0021A80AB5|nr:helix-turn-helix domain-containing protein [Levilactobacillus brevis]MCT3582519.1 HTH domain-containing protein [Levilactobacillus brevis]
MTKTVKELADELNVSRQYVQKVISKLPATKKPKKVQHSYQIDNRVEAYIRDFMGISDDIEATGDNQNCTSDSNSDSNKYENALLSQIDNLKLQVKQKDFQLENMQKLLDQSQQLQLMAENKIKQLENKMTGEQDKKESAEEPVQTSNVDNTVAKAERGFWSRLFKW